MSNEHSTSDKEHASGAFLWSGTTPEGDFSLPWRIALLPLYLAMHAYHCIRGTPVYIQYGDHDHRRELHTDSSHQVDNDGG